MKASLKIFIIFLVSFLNLTEGWTFILNGKVTTNFRPVVNLNNYNLFEAKEDKVYMSKRMLNEAIPCSAVAISPKSFLTAAHCVQNYCDYDRKKQLNVYPDFDEQIYKRRLKIVGQSHADIARIACINYKPYTCAKCATHDLAIVTLDRRSRNISYYKINPKPIEDNSSVFSIGYGAHDLEISSLNEKGENFIIKPIFDGRKRYLKTKVSSEADFFGFKFLISSDNHTFYEEILGVDTTLTNKRNPMIISGDSGGALLNEHFELIGLNVKARFNHAWYRLYKNISFSEGVFLPLSNIDNIKFINAELQETNQAKYQVKGI